MITDIPLRGLTADSRQVRAGYLFAALPGQITDGATFIPAAIEAGAVAVLTGRETDIGPWRDSPVTFITDDNPRRRLARMAARFYSAQPAFCAAVTGTNGKTSVASFARQLWRALGLCSASIGTLGVETDCSDVGNMGICGLSDLTTPDPVGLHRQLQLLASGGVNHACLEASSHGLAQYRLDGVHFSAAAFTNLSHDHLDYHGSTASYRAAKFRLFAELLPNYAALVAPVAAPEWPELERIADTRDLRLIGTAMGEGRGDIICRHAEALESGFRLNLRVMGDDLSVRFPLSGRFQIANALTALGLVIAAGCCPAAATARLACLAPVRGRLERVARLANGADILVDYAHSPDALATVLDALTPHLAESGRLHVLFGCGGDRDREKRPLMGRIACARAGRVIVTDDNPRHEDPDAIRADILAGCADREPEVDLLEIASREEAIEAAIRGLGTGDILVIAGKGHETGQIIGARNIPFDDAALARRCADSLNGAGGDVSP